MLKMFSLSAISFVIFMTGCGQSFDSLPPEVATRSLAHCMAYHSTVKKDLESLSSRTGELLAKPNVRANFRSEANEWIVAYSMGSEELKQSAISSAKKACSQVGLPD